MPRLGLRCRNQFYLYYIGWRVAVLQKKAFERLACAKPNFDGPAVPFESTTDTVQKMGLNLLTMLIEGFARGPESPMFADM